MRVGSTLADGGGTPGLAKCGRRADTSGVRPAEGFGNFDVEPMEDPEMRRGCNGCCAGSRKGTGGGMIREGKTAG